MRKVKYYKCPECGKKFKTLGGWGEHVQTMHPGSIPEGFTIARYFYFTLTGKTAGSCIMCKSPTQWNESTGKYDRFCTNPKCKQEYVKIAKKRMRDKYGKEYLLNDPEMQRKMLAAKHISGEYAFSDGSGKLGYVGTYEKDFLMMMDKFMRYSATDIIAPSPHTYYYEYQGTKHFYIPDFYVPNLNLEIEIKAQDNTHPKIQAIDKVKERLKDEMMMANPKINYLKINDKNYNNFFEYLLSLKDQIDDKDVSPSTKNSAEFKAATESAFDYYENTEVPEYESATESLIPESKTEDLNPVIVVFSSYVNPLLAKIKTYVPDRFNSFGIVLKDSSDPYGFSLYSIEPSADWLIEGYPISCYFKKQSISEIPQGASMMSIVTYVSSDEYDKIQKRVNNPEIIFTGWSELLETWFSHSDRYRFFCNRLISAALNEEKNFESRDYILLTISTSNAEIPYWEDLRNKLLILAESPMGPARERQAFEESVLEESLYGYLPEEMEAACENAFSGWEDVITEDLDIDDDDYEYDIGIEPVEESYIFSTEDYEQNLDKWKPGGSNILFITGLSGSGKSTLSKKLAKENNAIRFEMDGLSRGFDTSNAGILDKLKERNPEYKRAVETHWKPSEKANLILRNERRHLLQTVAKDLIKICQDDKDNLYIIEGIQIFGWLNPSYFTDKPVIIKGTSAMKSYFRAVKREGIGNCIKAILDGEQFQFIPKNWIDDEKMLSNFKKGATESTYDEEPAEESLFKSNLNKNYTPKGKHDLIDFDKKNIDQSTINKYKSTFKTMCHLRPYGVHDKTIGWFDHDKLVAYTSVNNSHKWDKYNWITSVEVSPDYQGYGLGSQLIDYAVHRLGGNALSVDADNEIALRLYERKGFKISPESKADVEAGRKTRYFMYIGNTTATESTYDEEPAEESLLLKTKFNKVKVKGTLSLTKFTRQDLTQEVLDKYKEKCASFGHCRISNMSKGYLYTDKSDNIVGFVNVVRKQDNIKWIQALNIQPHYQGYGLYEQIMKVAVRELGGTDIETPPKNDTAKLVYQKFGFRTYTNETTRHAMTIRSDAKAEKYDAKAKPNATTIVEAGLHPVYILLLDAKMGFGNVVKFFTNAPYSHALIGFDSSMSKMYSFATRDGHTMVPLGFSEENISTYAKKNSRSKYALYVKLVDTKDYKLMKSKLASFTSNKTDFRYDVGGAVKAFMGKHNANEKRYFCSGFVAYILNSGKSQVTEKEYDLTKPMDLTDVKNIHLVDMGLCKDYNQAYVEKKVKQIFEKHYMHKEKDSHHQPIDEEEELKKDKKENNEG